MKKSTQFLICFFLFFGEIKAQIKVYSGGNIYVGSTAGTGPATKLQVVGNSVFSAGTGSITSSPYIKGTNTWSSPTSPDYTWSGSTTTTGIFHTGNNMIGFCTNGNERLRINAVGKLLSNSNSNSTPDYSWKGDSTTGIYRPSAGVIGIINQSFERFRFASNGQLLSSVSSSASVPDYSFFNEPNSGMFRPVVSSLAFTVAGSEKYRINSIGQFINMNSSNSASTPDFTWNSNSNTGIYRPGTDIVGISAGGNEKMRISASNNVQINTTSVNNGKLNIVSSNGSKALWCEYTTNSDWQESIVTNIDRANSGNYVVKQSGTTNFYVAGAGWIYSQGQYIGSDLNLKENVATISGALQKINAMRGVTYNLKTEVNNPIGYGLTTANSYIGVVAQEIEAIAPELVRTMPNGTKAVAYQNMVGLLIEAIKEQSTQIAQLKQEIEMCCSSKTSATERATEKQANENLNTAKSNNTPFLAQNNPNPFNQSTSITYNVPDKANNAGILVFDLNGKLLRTYTIEGIGEGTISIDAKQFVAGMYFYSLFIDKKEVATKRMILTDK